MGGIEKKDGRRPRRRGDRRPRVYRPGPFAAIYSALLIVGSVGAFGLYFLLLHVMHGAGATLSTKLDVAKTALLVVGGSGAVAGLYVSYRKQRTDEANHVRDQDKLFTERYTAAVAQLRNTTSAAIRLGGVYALARIADDSERDRPTCLKVLCAYLRMPYDPDSAEPAERQVRTTAQTVIAERLRPEHPGFWTDAEIDLRGAHLISLGFGDVSIGVFAAEGATFGGEAWFVGATFSGDARFTGATFSGEAWFVKAAFGEAAWFDAVKFGEAARFGRATFGGDAWFVGAKFSGVAWFGGDARFAGTTFAGDAQFDGATFSRTAGFAKATFSKDARFDRATFRRDHPPVWPDGFAEPAGIAWDPPDPTPDLGQDPPDPVPGPDAAP